MDLELGEEMLPDRQEMAQISLKQAIMQQLLLPKPLKLLAYCLDQPDSEAVLHMIYLIAECS